MGWGGCPTKDAQASYSWRAPKVGLFLKTPTEPHSESNNARTRLDLGGYAQELSAYIQGHEQLFPDDVQDTWFLTNAHKAALIHLSIDVLGTETVKGAETDDKRKEAIETILANDLAQVDAEALPAHFEQTDLENALTSYSGELAKTLGKHCASREEVRCVDFGDGLDSLVENVVKQHTDAWISSAITNHALPLKRVIGSLPVDEMAELAETLIMLESLKEKVTRPTESVGGPIDVCVISKSDGFVWIKRKHYFDPKLNPQYFLRQGAKFE